MPQTDMYSSLLNTGSPVVVVLHLIPPQLRVLAFLLPLRLFRPILKLTASPPSFNRRPSGPFLDGLAVELKEQIIRLVDPIGLISLRQTNLHFRSIIEPQRQQSIERLLALECLPRYGGSLLPFTKCPGKALWSDPDLLATQTRSRWACTGCKRLLPYYHFQYKFLAEVIWRKPPPGSPATKIITSWEPGLGRIARVVTPLTPLPADGGRSIQDRYNLIVGDILAISPNELFNQIRNHNLNHFEGMHYGDFLGRITYNPNNIRELLLWNLISMQNSEFGSSRHHRKCNACQFKNHVFNNATIASHNGMFEIFDKACCNACFMEQNGQSALAEYLCRWFVFLVKQQPEDVQSELLSEASRFMTNYGAIIHPTAFQDWNQTCLEIDSSRSQGESPWHLSPRSQLLFKHWFRIFGLAADAFPDDPRGQFHKQRV
ncbi:uncharacterized protein FFNC_00363 [Fusarium fujikuroi]|nr:uncharacterized protein FFNC_00363 [Fusarium fujikuroi]SCV26619.1 uncharacterized protein FFFS_00361 [Fusarium fujikuroi]